MEFELGDRVKLVDTSGGVMCLSNFINKKGIITDWWKQKDSYIKLSVTFDDGSKLGDISATRFEKINEDLQNGI